MVKTLIAVLISSILTINALAEVKTFSVTVKRIMGEHESRDELREFATLEAKRQALEQAGAYLQTETSVKNYKLESDEITVLAAGVLSTKQAKEEWAMEGGHFVIKLTYEITIETSDLDKKITALRNDTDKMKDNKRLQAEVDQLRREIAKLREDIEEAPKSEVEVLKQDRKRLSNEVEATEWAEKARDEEDSEKKIEYLSKAIELNPEYTGAYLARANEYFNKKKLDFALNDFTKVIELDTTLIGQASLEKRASIYVEKKEYKEALKDYNRALDYPESLWDYQILLGRGQTYIFMNDYQAAIKDFGEATKQDWFLGDGDAYVGLFICYNALNDYSKCFEVLNEGIEKNSSNEHLYLKRGACYFRRYQTSKDQADAQKGIEDFEKAKKLGNEQAKKILEDIYKKN